MHVNHPKPVQDYTTANLILIFVNLMWIFGVVWTTLGFGAVLILAALLNVAITRIGVYRVARDKRLTRIGKPAG